MTNRTNAQNKDAEENSTRDVYGLMVTVAELAKEMNCSRGFIYGVLKAPDGPDFIKINSKTLINRREWVRYLERKTVRRNAIEEETGAA